MKNIELSDAIIKKYKIRLTGRDGSSLETTIPKEAFEREARRLGLSVEEAVKALLVVWHYDSFTGLHLTFEPKEE